MRHDGLARNRTHDWIVDLLSKGKRGSLLDIPAGRGSLAVRLKEKGFDVSCGDINPSTFKVEGIEIRKGDLSQSLPFPAETFDFVTCIDGLEHVENPANAIREFQRILKPGGKLILSLPNYLNIERRLRFLFTGLVSKIPLPKRSGKDRFENLWMLHITILTYPVLKLFLEYSGFEVLEIGQDKKKKKMRWLLPLVWLIRLYSIFWSKDQKENYHLEDTLSPSLIMGGNILILVAGKKETE